MAPVLIVAVCLSIVVSKTNIKISQIVIRQNDLVFPACQFIDICTDTPPVNDIIVFHGQVNILIGPVDHLFVRRDGAPEFFLFLTEVDG